MYKVKKSYSGEVPLPGTPPLTDWYYYFGRPHLIFDNSNTGTRCVPRLWLNISEVCACVVRYICERNEQLIYRLPSEHSVIKLFYKD